MSQNHSWRIVRVAPDDVDNRGAAETPLQCEIREVEFGERYGTGTLHFSIDRIDGFDPLSVAFRAYRDDALVGDFARAQMSGFRGGAARLLCHDVPDWWQRMTIPPMETP